MNIDDLGKSTLSRTLGGYSIEKLVAARRRTTEEELARWVSPVIVEKSDEADDEIGVLRLNADVVQTGGMLSLESVLSAPALAPIAPPVLMAAPSLAAPGDAAQDAATYLKMRLAVRDWTDPQALLPPGLDPPTRDLALAIVAPEARTEVNSQKGKWYYEVSARRRILATRDLGDLRECVTPIDGEDAKDPIRRAFELLLAEPPEEPDSEMDLEVLRAMSSAGDWLGQHCHVDRDRIAALIEKRMRQEDVDRILRQPLIGRDAQRDRLRDFVLKPRNVQSLAVIEMYGVGGSGKSTLLAHVEAATRGLPDAPVLVHLDFDREFLDVDDPYSMDLALLDAIAGARPDKAAACIALANELASLRQSERDDRQSLLGKTGRKLGAAARKGNFGYAEQEALEGVVASEGSRRQSLTWDRLAPNSDIGSGLRLALVLDTLEHVFGRGTSATFALFQWLNCLTTELHSVGACVILSGRDPPPTGTPWTMPYAPPAGFSVHLPTILGGVGHQVDQPPIELGELDPDDAVHFLTIYGVDDPVTAQAAAAALPRVPLLLRIAADVLKEPEVADEVRAAHAEGRVDSETSRRYLADRIVRHVADPVARDYVTSAFALPEISEKLLHDIVVPIVDEAAGRDTERGRAKRVYRALLDSSWLTVRASDSQSFNFLPAIRSLALKLIESDPREAALMGSVRLAAIDWHARRRSPKDNAFGIYHSLMLGRPAGKIENPEETVAILARVLDDLPDAGRAALMQGGQTAPSPTTAFVTEGEWRASLEGIGKMRGQGAELVRRGETEAALTIYKGRPTREAGVPPDFVIQAVAYGGGWDDPVVDIDKVLEEIEEKSRRVDGQWRVPGTLRSRLYWTTRLALLRNPAPLSARHEALLAGAAADIKAISGQAALPAIIAVAEAFSGSRVGMPSWLKARGAMAPIVRYPLVQSLIHGNPVEWRAPVETMTVVQKEWSERDLSLDVVDFSIALRSQARETVMDLDGIPLHQVNRQLRALRQPIRVPVPDLTPIEQVIILRGKTTEFLRPLAHALSRGMDPQTLDTVRAIGIAHRDTLNRMSILPELPPPAQLAKRNFASREKSWLGIIDMFDLARVLPYFCTRLADAAAGSDVGRIAGAFLAWDAALTRGGSSEWMHERVGEWGPREPAPAPATAGGGANMMA